jgi:hypothetical protein
MLFDGPRKIEPPPQFTMELSASAEPRRKKFTRDEDERLRRLIRQFGDRDWASICRHMPGRNARQCRHRYNNYLVEGHQHAVWTEAEEQVILAKYQEFGPKWVRISSFLTGRTGNDVKNRWHKHIVKRYFGKDFPLTCTSPEAEQPIFDEMFLERNRMAAPPKMPLSPFLRFVLN